MMGAEPAGSSISVVSAAAVAAVSGKRGAARKGIPYRIRLMHNVGGIPRERQ